MTRLQAMEMRMPLMPYFRQLQVRRIAMIKVAGGGGIEFILQIGVPIAGTPPIFSEGALRLEGRRCRAEDKVIRKFPRHGHSPLILSRANFNAPTGSRVSFT